MNYRLSNLQRAKKKFISLNLNFTGMKVINTFTKHIRFMVN